MLVPRNITVTPEDDRYVQVNFVHTGYMECYQAYRKGGLYTDVSVNCLHPNSGDETIYPAHSVLLSAASPYFSFILMKAFNQLTNMRTSNLRKTLHVIENDNSFQDQSLNSEENFLNLKFQTFCRVTNSSNDLPSYCNCVSPSSSLPCASSSGGSESSDHSRNDPNFNRKKCQFTSSESWTFTIRSFVSANNIVLVVKGIDPLYVKYVLYCVYSESFLIDKRDINIFLGLITEMKLTNHSTLSKLLKPYIEQVPHIITAVCRSSVLSENLADNQIDTNPILNNRSMENFTVFNSLYDTQLEYALKLRDESSISNLGETLADCAQTDFHMYEIPKKNGNCTLSGGTFVSDAFKNNSTNVVYNSTFESSSFNPYSSENDTIRSFTTEESGSSKLATSQTMDDNRMFIEEYENDFHNAGQFNSIKRKADMMLSEGSSSTSALRMESDCVTPSRLLNSENQSSSIPVMETSQGKENVVNVKEKTILDNIDYEMESCAAKNIAFDDLIEKKKDAVLSGYCKNDENATYPLTYENTDTVLKKLENYPALQVTRLDIHDHIRNTFKTIDNAKQNHNLNIVIAEVNNVGRAFQGIQNYSKKEEFFEVGNCTENQELSGSRNSTREKELHEPRHCNKRQELHEAKYSTETLELSEPKISIKKPKLSESKNSIKKLELSEPLNSHKKTELSEQKNYLKKPEISKSKNSINKPEIYKIKTSIKKVEFFEPKSFCKKPEITESKNFYKKSEITESKNSIKKLELFESKNSIKKPELFESKICIKKSKLNKPKDFIKKSELSKPKDSTKKVKPELFKPKNSIKKLELSDPRFSFAEIFPDLRRIRKQDTNIMEEDFNNKSLEKSTNCSKVTNKSSEIQYVSPAADVGPIERLITKAVNANSEEDRVNHIKCFGCDFTSTVFIDFITHIKLTHCNEKVKIAHCVDLNCCVQLLLCSKEWEIHVHRHLEKFFYNCSFCSYSTTTKTGVTRHERTHKKWSKRNAKPLCMSNTMKKSQPIHVGCVTRSARKVVESPIGTLLYKQKKNFPNQIKVKNVFATWIFRKLKRGIRMRQHLYSTNDHSRFLKLLGRLPILTLPAEKAFKSSQEKIIHPESGNSEDKKISLGDQLDNNSLQIMEKSNNDANSLLEKEKDVKFNKKQETKAGEEPFVKVGESKEKKITVKEYQVYQKFSIKEKVTDIHTHTGSNFKDNTKADGNLALEQADSKIGMMSRPIEQEKNDRNILLKRKEKLNLVNDKEKKLKMNNNIGKETLTKVVNSHLKIKETENVSFLRENRCEEGNIYEFGKVLIRETRLKMDKEVNCQRKGSNVKNSNIGGKLYKFKDSSYRKKVKNGEDSFGESNLHKNNSVQRERCSLAIEDLNLLKEYSLKPENQSFGEIDLMKIKDLLKEKESLKTKHSDVPEKDVSETGNSSTSRGIDQAMDSNHKDKDITEDSNYREKCSSKTNDLNLKNDIQLNEDSNLKGNDFSKIENTSLKGNNSLNPEYWNLRERNLSDIADSNHRGKRLKIESSNQRKNYSSENENWNFREGFYSAKPLKTRKYAGNSESLSLGKRDQPKVHVASLRETELSKGRDAFKKNLTSKDKYMERTDSGILTNFFVNSRNIKGLCMKEKKKQICNLCNMKLSSQKGLEKHYNLYHPYATPCSCTLREHEDQLPRTSCPNCSKDKIYSLGRACDHL